MSEHFLLATRNVLLQEKKYIAEETMVLSLWLKKTNLKKVVASEIIPVEIKTAFHTPLFYGTNTNI